MKKLYLILIITLLCVYSCKKSQNEHSRPERSPVVTDVNQDFLQEFPTVKFDTLKVEAPIFEELNATQKRLHKDYLNLYPSGFMGKDATNPPLYALSKFSINQKLVGLLIQGQGKRSKTAVTLMIYDHSLGKITSFFEIADHAEEFGYKDIKKTWLFNKDGNLSGFYTLKSTITPKDANDPTKPMDFSEYYELKLNDNTLIPKKLTENEAAKYLKILK